jgi:biotin carboxyl carrier protein
MGMESGKKKLKELKAPMPGLVLDVLVKSGDTVTIGQDLLVLEAMKMENSIKSPQEGVIDEISIQKQDKVEKNQILLSFE